ncbi:hypothetical protein ACFL5V_10290 [Fibrobacterota bacterium]
MIKLRTLLFIFLAPLLCLAEDKEEPRKSYMVIVNSENIIEHITRNELVVIYLGKKTLWENEIRIIPAMLYERKKPMREFIEAELHKTLGQYRAYWKRRLFSGGGTVPRTFRTAKELMNFVARKPGAIGIVPAGTELIEGVKAVDNGTEP